jgi:hypothetical protein
MFENRVLRRTFQPKTEAGNDCIIMSSSPNSIKVIKSRIRWVGHVVHMGGKTNVYKILLRKPKGRSTCRWEDNIRLHLREIGWRGV